MTPNELREILTAKKIKVTPQRIAVLDAVYSLQNHPTAEQIIEYIHVRYPSIATGTVYKVLDACTQHNLIKKVKTEKDVMRYDGNVQQHHHVYCVECDYIEDYYDEKLDAILHAYFSEHSIDNFIIEDVKLQVNGRFIVHKSNSINSNNNKI